MRDNIFKILGSVDVAVALAQFTPIINMMKEQDIDQWGLLGREVDGVVDYGEGKTRRSEVLSGWNIWREPSLNTGWFREFLDSLAPRKIGRSRIMRMTGKSCYSWHKDTSPRVHVPLITTRDNFMVVGPISHHLTIGNAWWVDTTKWHTAMNCSEKDRFHLILEVSE